MLKETGCKACIFAVCHAPVLHHPPSSPTLPLHQTTSSLPATLLRSSAPTTSTLALFIYLLTLACIYIDHYVIAISFNLIQKTIPQFLFSQFFSLFHFLHGIRASHFPLHFFQNIASFSKPPDLLKPNTDRGTKFLAKNPIQNKQSQTVYLKPFSSITTQSFEFIKTL